MARLTLEEQETIIHWDRAESCAVVYSADPYMIKKIDKLLNDDDSVSLKRRDDTSIEVTMPKIYIRVKAPSKRQLTEEQRAEISNRLQKSRNKAFL